MAGLRIRRLHMADMPEIVRGPGTAVTRSRRRGTITGPTGFAAAALMILISAVVFPIAATAALLKGGPKGVARTARHFRDAGRNALVQARR